MDVDLVVVFLGHILRIEALGCKRILSHESCSDSLVDLCIKLLDGTDALFFLAVLRHPDRERSTPIAASAEVPVLDVLKPLSETACTCRLRLPHDLLVELHHSFTYRGGLDEP